MWMFLAWLRGWRRTRRERWDLVFDLDVYPYLPRATVGKTSPASYLCLMGGGAR